MCDCHFAAERLLDEVHCPHAAQVVRVAHQFAAWGVQADFAAVAAHPAATWAFSLLARAVIIIIDAVVVLAQHRQVRRLCMTAILMRINVVDLAPISGHVAVWPRTDEILRHG